MSQPSPVFFLPPHPPFCSTGFGSLSPYIMFFLLNHIALFDNFYQECVEKMKKRINQQNQGSKISEHKIKMVKKSIRRCKCKKYAANSKSICQLIILGRNCSLFSFPIVGANLAIIKHFFKRTLISFRAPPQYLALIQQKMSFDKIVSALFKQDPHLKAFKQVNLLSNSLSAPFLPACMKLYEQSIMKGQQELLIKNILKLLEQKGQIMRKTKIMSMWIEMFKLTKYDLSDIIMNKKLKIFTKTATLKQAPSLPREDNLEEYLLVQVLVPQYNYFMKLSVNEELFKLCVIGKVPQDDIFRRGTKIKFIWIFKLYNLIHPLLPIVSACASVLAKFPQLEAVRDIGYQCYQDILTMNQFVIEAIEEGAEDNFLLMPYFQMLQFYQTLSEQRQVFQKIEQLYIKLSKTDQKKRGLPTPRKMNVDPEIIEQIETQTMRVKLISNSVKNPKKDHTRLQTQYHDRLQQRQSRILKTSANQTALDRQYSSFTEKYRHLD